jgi:hypothetical protein
MSILLFVVLVALGIAGALHYFKKSPTPPDKFTPPIETRPLEGPHSRANLPKHIVPKASPIIPERIELTPELLKSRLTYHLMYQDRDLSDVDRAKLVRFVGNVVSTERWPTAEMAPGEAVPDFVNRVYNLTAKKEPESVEAISGLLRGANTAHLAPAGAVTERTPQNGDSLRIPPIPVHVTDRTDEVSPELLRVQPIGEHNLRWAGGPERLAEIPAKELPIDSQPKAGDTTILMLGTYADLEREIRRHGRLPELPGSIRMFRNDGYVDLVLRQPDGQGPTADCDEAQKWLATLSSNERIVALRDRLGYRTLKKEVLERANSAHMLIVDWSSPPLYHGQKVAAVARYVLSEVLKQPELALPPYFDFVDLNPSIPLNREPLLKAVKKYEEPSWYCSATNSCDPSAKQLPPYISHRFKCAKAWIDSGGQIDPVLCRRVIFSGVPANAATNDPRRIPVAQMVLEAILWSHLLEPSSKDWVVNMSFTVEFVLGISNQISASKSLIIAAASDEHNPEVPAEFPQGSTATNSNIVTVTFGNRDGRVLGGYTFSDKPGHDMVIVSMLAPGCGYPSLDSKGQYGSSYASPFVASLAWAKHLADGLGIEDAREQLIKSSIMRPAEIDIESAGVFEPAILGFQNESWYAEYPGPATGLIKGELELTYKDDDGRDQILKKDNNDDCSLAVYQGDNDTLLVQLRRCPRHSMRASEVITINSCTLTDDHDRMLPFCADKDHKLNGLLQVVFNGQRLKKAANANLQGETPK